MTATTVHVRALHQDGDWLVECTECGVVGVVTSHVNAYCLAHLAAHGVDTTGFEHGTLDE